MAVISSSMEVFWTTNFESRAREKRLNQVQADQLRAAVKGTLIDAGWAKPDGSLEFCSRADAAAAYKAALECFQPLADRYSREARVQVGSTPTRTTVAAFTSGDGNNTAVFQAAQNTVSSSFRPGVPGLHDKCPRCSSSMQPVRLVNDRVAIYCSKDRVVLPLPVGTRLG